MKLKIILIIGGIIILGLAVYYFNLNDKLEKVLNHEKPLIEDIIKDKEEDELKEKQEEPSYYYVDIKGAVVNPNVYRLEKDKRVIDAINIAGGLTKEADSSPLNLSKKITDEMLIIVYTKNEIKAFKNKLKTNQNDELIDYIKKNNLCPDPKTNQACANNQQSDSENTNQTNNKVSINQADFNLLKTLPGIGDVKANAIIAYREANGPFEAIEDIKKVNGIGDSIFDQIKDYLTL